ncbi:hypothetical protein PIB30_084632 [Stylosanthes scabra]|uniref:Transmembrane protein n=1 Tax=Stylosanthes scabra TaxID=79078 RepID=A0ABU6SSU7_9FABA|nr:hypothetical protein [Stylosanthes scabra]
MMMNDFKKAMNIVLECMNIQRKYEKDRIFIDKKVYKRNQIGLQLLEIKKSNSAKFVNFPRLGIAVHALAWSSEVGLGSLLLKLRLPTPRLHLWCLGVAFGCLGVTLDAYTLSFRLLGHA